MFLKPDRYLAEFHLNSTSLSDGGNLLGDGVHLLGDGGDLLDDGVDFLGDGGDLLDDGGDLLDDGVNLLFTLGDQRLEIRKCDQLTV